MTGTKTKSLFLRGSIHDAKWVHLRLIVWDLVRFDDVHPRALGT